jgi:hypothetical protein
MKKILSVLVFALVLSTLTCMGQATPPAGKTQRQVEGEVVNACLQAGSDGMSLWPWVRSGPCSMGDTTS